MQVHISVHGTHCVLSSFKKLSWNFEVVTACAQITAFPSEFYLVLIETHFWFALLGVRNQV